MLKRLGVLVDWPMCTFPPFRLSRRGRDMSISNGFSHLSTSLSSRRLWCCEDERFQPWAQTNECCKTTCTRTEKNLYRQASGRDSREHKRRISFYQGLSTIGWCLARKFGHWYADYYSVLPYSFPPVYYSFVSGTDSSFFSLHFYGAPTVWTSRSWKDSLWDLGMTDPRALSASFLSNKHNNYCDLWGVGSLQLNPALVCTTVPVQWHWQVSATPSGS